MKKFDLSKAKQGNKIATRRGKDAEILKFDRDNKEFPLVVIEGNTKVYVCTLDGKFYTDKDSDFDLFLKN